MLHRWARPNLSLTPHLNQIQLCQVVLPFWCICVWALSYGVKLHVKGIQTDLLQLNHIARPGLRHVCRLTNDSHPKQFLFHTHSGLAILQKAWVDLSSSKLLSMMPCEIRSDSMRTHLMWGWLQAKQQNFYPEWNRL